MAVQIPDTDRLQNFLLVDGEMAERTRSYDWSNTPVGSPENWPLHLRTTVEMILSSRFPMFLWWGEDLIQFYNDAYRPSLGNNGKHPAALGQKAEDCWPEIWDIIYPLIQQVQTTGKATWSEDQLIPIYRNGKIEDVYWTFGYSAIKSEHGTIDGVLVVCHETTEKVLAGKNTQDAQLQLRSVVESAPFPIGVYTGKEMNILLANKSIMDVWGKGYDVIGKSYKNILPELENQQIFRQLDGVYTTGIPFHARNQRVDLEVNGALQPYYFNYSFTPLFDADGNVYGVMNTGADVTDLNLAKQKIEQSEKNFRNMVLQAPVAMCILLGPLHIVEVVNELMIEIWGKELDKVLNKPVFEALPDAREQGLEELMNRVYETGETFTASEMPVNLFRNGKWDTVYQNFVYEPYKDTDGAIVGVLAISVDVSAQVIARHKIEEVVTERTRELATANIHLQRSNAELEQFAYIASHDLQEPLRKVSTYVQMLEKSLGKIDEHSVAYFDKIKSSTRRMVALIKDVLAYSEVAKSQRAYVPVDLVKVVDDIVSDLELLIEQKQASISYHQLPTINAIPLQMSQLFANLLSNSLKYSKAGEPPVITIRASVPDRTELSKWPSLDPLLSYFSIEVSDNGIGFNNIYAERIFSIFQRLHNRDKYEGTGIGLALCQRIVQNHSGSISATSEEGKGSTFVILLPERQARI